MKLTIESTDAIVQVFPREGATPVPGRLWEGTTESGVHVVLVVTRVAVSKDAPPDVLERFAKELKEQRAPSAIANEAIPLRLIL